MMKTGNTLKASPGWRQWAATQLGVSADASPCQARAALLRRLAQADFVPDSSWRPAWQILSGQLLSPPQETLVEDEAFLEAESRLRTQVEAFAAEFWRLSCEERYLRWQELLAQCDLSPPLRYRLQRLADGLRIGPISLDADHPRVMQLIGQIQEMFVQRPPARAELRQIFRRRMRLPAADADRRQVKSALPEWEAAARELQWRHPEIAVLEADLVAGLIDWREKQKDIAKMRRRLEAKRRKSVQGQQSSGVPRWLIYVVIAVLLRFGAMLFRSSNSSSPPRTSSPSSAPAPNENDRLQKVLDDMRKQKDKARNFRGQKP